MMTMMMHPFAAARKPSRFAAATFAALAAVLAFASAQEGALAAPPTAPATTVVSPPENARSGSLTTVNVGSGANSRSESSGSGEDWKGTSLPPQFTVGGMVGMGNVESDTGFAVIPFASYTVVQRGFVPDINDSVAVEAELGPVFVTGNSGWIYSLHLRWDFNKDAVLTPYAIGGVGGSIRGNSVLNTTRFLLFPRFAAGVLYKINQNLALRGELSHELIGIGASFSL